LATEVLRHCPFAFNFDLLVLLLAGPHIDWLFCVFSTLLDFYGHLADMVVLEYLLPTHHAVSHFVELLELVVIVGVPVQILVFTPVAQSV
jgi:hypothetical protein